MRSIRIGGGMGYWGDDIAAPLRLVCDGDIDYLVMDFLAEVTMSILQKQKRRNPDAGYATDVVDVIRSVLPEAVERGVKIVCNAGGVNPTACADAVLAVAEELGLADRVKVAAILGDDLLGRVEELRSSGVSLDNTETGQSLDEIDGRLASANAYIGAEPLVSALRDGATIIVSGRVADPSLTLGALRHEFGWKADEWDLLSAGIVAGHLVECGAHSSGGNHQAGWERVPDMGDIGFPIVEVDESGRIVMTKVANSGGLVDRETVIEQLLYEIGDPRRYLTPDVSCDWTSFRVTDLGNDQVEITGCTGAPAPATLKVSAAYPDGYSAVSMFLYSGPDAPGRARKALEVIEYRVHRLGLDLEPIHHDFIGLGAVHGRRTPRTWEGEPCEVVLRVGFRGPDRAQVSRAVTELSTVFHGPPGKTNLITGRARVSETLSYWPTLVPRDRVKPEVVMVAEVAR
ncbi:acyclic terpene utilization AtuA family protein [Nocardia rhamnosiphila]|uniref:Acyclic terpene utilization AtuA family protein n=1 Tax=Nocardia rhamnosiphila TaxID=426716 RepID=A0ABV2WYU9_9NOCA